MNLDMIMIMITDTSTSEAININICSAGAIITGGSDSRLSVEVFNPHKEENCTLPNLPNSRYGHTLCGGLLCGGKSDSQSCLRWIREKRTFVPTQVRLKSVRTHHLCWSNPYNSGILLIGGIGSSKTSELVVGDGSGSVSGFDLQYPAV